MAYVARRKFRMYGQDFAQPGNAYDLPHIVPTDLVERVPHRSILNMLSRGMLQQVEAKEITVGDVRPVATVGPVGLPTDIEFDPRVSKEGHGWYLVDGKRVHGRKGVKRALTELGG